ncbi:uncharacterized protein LOC127831206 [Dreissena polymorpha]|uniref:uncharacterized protein LOC127831206 n=1 Tax=Dreissena polymorpha TaxID=45954 RepID=UPI002264D33C|nr:uncharacterized protein LOC127831206 [Dreissena polymorpha]
MAQSRRRGQMCCVYGCVNCRYDKENALSDNHFFNIPKHVLENRKQKQRWCALIKRQDGLDGFNMTPRTVICHEHFLESDFKKALGSKRWTLEPGVEPSVFNWSKVSERKPPKNRLPLSPSKDQANLMVDAPVSPDNHPEFTAVKLPQMADKACQTETEDLIAEVSVQPVSSKHCDHEYSTLKSFTDVELLSEQLKACQAKCDYLEKTIDELNATISEFEANRFSLEKISDDKHAVMFYTGFPNIETFNAFFKYLETKSEKLNYWRGRSESGEDAPKHQTHSTSRPGKKRALSTKEELFMVLVRLKVGLFVRDISERFGISQGHFSKIFTTWIIFLSHELPGLFIPLS